MTINTIITVMAMIPKIKYGPIPGQQRKKIKLFRTKSLSHFIIFSIFFIVLSLKQFIREIYLNSHLKLLKTEENANIKL